MGLRMSPLASGEHTLLSELGRKFQVKSYGDRYTGVGISPLGVRGANTARH
jgi:hypothetical protein